MKVHNRETGGMRGKIILLGIAVAALFWVTKTGINALLFHEGTFVQQVFTLDTIEVWMKGNWSTWN